MEQIPNLEDVCRLCCKGDGSLMDLFDDVLCSDMATNIYICFTIQVSPRDKISKKICKQCFFLINSYTELRMLAVNNDAKLKKEYARREKMKVEESEDKSAHTSTHKSRSCAPKKRYIESDSSSLSSLSDSRESSPGPDHNFKKRKSNRTYFHPTVKKIKKMFANVSIPEDCYGLDLEPRVLVSTTAVDEWVLNNLKSGNWSLDPSKNKMGLYFTKVDREEAWSDSSSQSSEDTEQIDPSYQYKKRKSSLASHVAIKRKGSCNSNSRKKSSSTKNQASPQELMQLEVLAPDCSNTSSASVLVEKKSTRLYICQTCNQVFDSSRGLQNHQRKHLSSLRCSLCAMTFTIVEDLVKHNRENHAEEPAREISSDSNSVQSIASIDDLLVISSEDEDVKAAKEEFPHKARRVRKSDLTQRRTLAVHGQSAKDSDNSDDFQLGTDEENISAQSNPTPEEKQVDPTKGHSLADEELYIKYVFENHLQAKSNKPFTKFSSCKKSWGLFNIGALLNKSFVPVEFIPDASQSKTTLKLQYKYRGNRRPAPKSTSYKWNMLNAIDIPQEPQRPSKLLGSVLTTSGQLCDLKQSQEPANASADHSLKSNISNRVEQLFAKILPNGSLQLIPNVQLSPNVNTTKASVVHKPMLLQPCDQSANVSIQNFWSINMAGLTTNAALAHQPVVSNVLTNVAPLSSSAVVSNPALTKDGKLMTILKTPGKMMQLPTKLSGGTVLVHHPNLPNTKLLLAPRPVISNNTAIQHSDPAVPPIAALSATTTRNTGHIINTVPISANFTVPVTIPTTISVPTTVPSAIDVSATPPSETTPHRPVIRLKSMAELTGKPSSPLPNDNSPNVAVAPDSDRLKLQNLYVERLTNYVNSSTNLPVGKTGEYIQI